MAEPIVTPREVYRNILNDVAHKHRLSIKAIEGHSRLPDIVEARAAVAKRLFAQGWTEQRIAQTMHRRLAAVQAYLGRQRYKPPADHKEEHHHD
jgi:hypothetical protein